MADIALLALPRDRAAKLSGFTPRQLDYWERTGLLQPAVDARLTPGRRIRQYQYQELISLLVIAELRRRGVTLQHIRKIVVHLTERGYSQPFTQLKYATHGQSIYFQHDDGSWASDETPDQLVIHQTLDLEPLVARIRAAAERDPTTYGRVDRRRGALGSKPVVAGTRVPIQTIRRYLDHGSTVSEILAAYPILVEQDIVAAQQESTVA